MNISVSVFPRVAALAGFVALATVPLQAQEAVQPSGPSISAEFPFESRFIEVNGSKIHYIDEGQGDPILFIHGNPTSSYLWRNIIPHVTPHGRVIALDLIGMGKSDKPAVDYRFATHADYLQAFIDALGLTDITLVVHDWGSALGMDFARRNPGRVKALAFMEAIVPPAMPVPSYEAMGPEAGGFFRDLRTPGVGETMILEHNVFVEMVLPEMGVLRELSSVERRAYAAPYATRKSRMPTLVWARELPIGGQPSDVTGVVERNGAWLLETEIPKLLFYADPGAFGGPEVAAHFASHLKNIETRYVGSGLHFLQEDHPHVIGQGLADWLRRIR